MKLTHPERALLARARRSPSVCVWGKSLATARRLVEIGALEDRGGCERKGRRFWITVEGLRLHAEGL